MRRDAIQLEESRLGGIREGHWPVLHERHRIFPQVFERRQHRKVLDLAAGVGYVAERIRDRYPAAVFCNEISPTCLRALKQQGLSAVSYTIDHDVACFPFEDGCFDAIIALATIEHVIHVDHLLRETYRILSDRGCFYVSAPNYASLQYLLGITWSGRTFHNPLSEAGRYEFFAHVRYFTFRTLLEYVGSFGFVPDAVYLPLPEASTRYCALYRSSKWRALAFRHAMRLLYQLSPRWSSEPVVCFRKAAAGEGESKYRKVIL